MNFGEAIQAMKDAKMVQRAGWNGKGMFLRLVPADGWASSHVPAGPDPQGYAKRLPWIGMKTADGCFVPWLASQTDILAEDWSEASGHAHYPAGMGEESRRLHREYNVLVAAQNAGAKNGADVVRLTDECAAKGIILVPGGENL